MESILMITNLTNFFMYIFTNVFQIGYTGNDIEDSPYEIWLYVLLIIFCIALLARWAYKQNNKEEIYKKEIGAIDDFICQGKYLSGFHNIRTGVKIVKCYITDKHLIFTRGVEYPEIGRIPRNSINQMLVEDKSKITQRITVTRLLTLGIFSVALPKKEEQELAYLLIDWNDEKGARQNTIFEHSFRSNAFKALNKLNQYVKSKQEPLDNIDEKKCPYCAEIIKKEATLCRYCGSKL